MKDIWRINKNLLMDDLDQCIPQAGGDFWSRPKIWWCLSGTAASKLVDRTWPGIIPGVGTNKTPFIECIPFIESIVPFTTSYKMLKVYSRWS